MSCGHPFKIIDKGDGDPFCFQPRNDFLLLSFLSVSTGGRAAAAHAFLVFFQRPKELVGNQEFHALGEIKVGPDSFLFDAVSPGSPGSEKSLDSGSHENATLVLVLKSFWTVLTVSKESPLLFSDLGLAKGLGPL